MIRVLYDYQAFVQRIGGVSRQHMEIIRWLSSETKAILPALLSDNIYLDEINHPHIAPFPSFFPDLRQNIFKQINQWISVCELKKGNYDIFHVTGLNPYFIPHTKKKVLATMHDLTFEKFPNLVGKANIVIEKRKKILNVVEHINCVSIQTKNDLVDIYDYPEDKISIVYPGTNGDFIEKKGEPIFNFPYILYIGGRKGYKNFKTFIKAFAQINQDIQLVCTGSVFGNEEMDLFDKLKISNRVHHKFVTDEEMNNLLCNAFLFVYPSLSEGFGLPILDSFRGSCPCIASDILCFHEVAADAALYFNPNEVDDIVDKMKKVLSDSQLRSEMIIKGRNRVPLFTWKKCAEETEKVYRSLI